MLTSNGCFQIFQHPNFARCFRCRTIRGDGHEIELHWTGNVRIRSARNSVAPFRHTNKQQRLLSIRIVAGDVRSESPATLSRSAVV